MNRMREYLQRRPVTTSWCLAWAYVIVAIAWPQ